MSKTALVAAIGLAGAGCATMSTLQTARPLQPGSAQVAVETGVSAESGRAPLPLVNVAVRYGFGRRWDLGVRAGAGGVGVTGKFALLDPVNETVALSLAPAFGGAHLGYGPVGVGTFYAQLPLLVGLSVGYGHELVVGPKVFDQVEFIGGTGLGVRRNVVGVGASVGGAIRLARGVRVFPELDFSRPLLGGSRVGFLHLGGGGVPGWQVGLALLLGGDR